MNPEAANRAAKANAISEHLIATICLADGSAPRDREASAQLAFDLTEAWDDVDWRAAAADAGVHAPSAVTVEQVRSALRIAAERFSNDELFGLFPWS